MKQIILLFLMALGLSACVSNPMAPCSAVAPAKYNKTPEHLARAKADGLKSYVVFKPGKVVPGVSIMSFNTKALFAKTAGGRLAKDMPDSNAFVIESKEKPEVPGYQVQEENIFYAHEVLYRHVPVETTATPCPNPNPNPEPTPTPTPITNLTWGQKMVRAGEASGISNASAIKVCDTDTGLDRAFFGEFPASTITGGASMVAGQAWDSDKVSGHGSHTAGTIGSTKYGVARVSLRIVKALSDQGSGSSSQLGGAIDDCNTWGAQVINASWGMDRGTDAFIGAAIDRFVARGGIFVASAGNSSGGPLGFPASKANVLAVTCNDEGGRICGFSSRGTKTGEMVIAPGNNVQSVPNGRMMSGTSMSAPHVTGIVAIALSKGKRQVGVKNLGLAPTDQGRGMAEAFLSASGM